ncbi:DUF5995 family protein [Streptomyces lavendulae]|uniref:DUF5995 family protein n=1 Tax=Streptomyces lavendulae TaxID=1914 RepID=UPI00382B53D6
MRITTENINWRPRTAPEALEALELLTERLREAGDDRAVFLDVYVVITRRVVEVMHTEDHDGFLEPEWLSEVTGLFAEEALIATRNSLHGTPVTLQPRAATRAVRLWRRRHPVHRLLGRTGCRPDTRGR